MLLLKPGKENTLMLQAPSHQSIREKLRAVPGIRWDPRIKQWILSCSDETLRQLERLFGPQLKIDPRVFLLPLRRELTIRRYSQKTIKSYLHHNYQLLQFSNKAPKEMNQEDIKTYIQNKLQEKEIATATVNQMINAFRFFYSHCLGKDFAYEVKRAKKDKILPKVLSLSEVQKIFLQTNNLKHKALLMLTYSAGLRVSEVVKLTLGDIDSKRKTIFIKGGKGRKDRISILSEKLIILLRHYYREFRPKTWLFPGYDKSRPLSIRSVQNIFSHSLEKAKIQKSIGIHSLRHSFATHLLEQGVNLRYIQELLGHKSPKTTQIYTYVSNQEISKIRNPLDSFDF